MSSSYDLGRDVALDIRENEVDIRIGEKIRILRKVLGVSQKQLAELIGVTSQQMQKYERAINQLSASRLQKMSYVLGVPIGFFFDEGFYPTEHSTPQNILNVFEDQALYEPHPLSKETLELVRAFSQIEAPEVRKKILKLTQELAKCMNSKG